MSLVALGFLLSGNILVALMIAITTHGALLIAQLNPSVQWLGSVVTSFHTKKKELWLTIDDGPDEVETPMVLDLLDEYQAKATFFVIGSRAELHPELIRQIVDRGHQLGNHTMNHPERSFWSLSKGRLKKEVGECSAVIANIVGQSPSLFRAPVGHKPLSLHAVLQDVDLPLIGWTARGFDGLSRDQARIVQRIQKQIRPGAIVLLHEGRGTLISTLGELLEGFTKEGYRCVVPTPDSFVCGRR